MLVFAHHWGSGPRQVTDTPSGVVDRQRPIGVEGHAVCLVHTMEGVSREHRRLRQIARISDRLGNGDHGFGRGQPGIEFADVGDTTTLANPEIDEQIRHAIRCRASGWPRARSRATPPKRSGRRSRHSATPSNPRCDVREGAHGCRRWLVIQLANHGVYDRRSWTTSPNPPAA